MTEYEAPTAPELLASREGAVLELTLNRPHRLNALNVPLVKRLLEALQGADADHDIRAIVITGAGRAFCAGRDVSDPPNVEMLELVQNVATQLVSGRQPVVAALHGWVVGAGCELALDCDLTVASRSARFHLPEISLGVFVTGGISALLPRCAGLARARRILLLGEPFDAAEAERWGLVGTLAEGDTEALQEARRQARRLASFDPLVVADFRQAVRELGASRFAQAIRLETVLQTAMEKRHFRP